MSASELKRLIEIRDSLLSENKKLIEENAKMTKRRAKLECKLKNAVRESKTIIHEVKLAIKHYEEKGTYKLGQFRQIIKNHSK